MISNFWNWIVQTVTLALNTLNQFVNNSETGPFMELLLVVILMACLIHFIIKPLIGYRSGAGHSDKVKKQSEEE